MSQGDLLKAVLYSNLSNYFNVMSPMLTKHAFLNISAILSSMLTQRTSARTRGKKSLTKGHGFWHQTDARDCTGPAGGYCLPEKMPKSFPKYEHLIRRWQGMPLKMIRGTSVPVMVLCKRTYGKEDEEKLCIECLDHRNDNCPREGSFNHSSKHRYNQGVGK